MRKVSAGQKLDIRAADWNAIIDAVSAFQLREQLGNPAAHAAVWPAVVKVKNSSGAGRRQGDVIQLSSALPSTLDRQHLWFDGIAPAAPLWRASHGVFLRQTPNNSIGDCQVSGACLAYVDIDDATHKRCDLTAGQYYLTSCFAGPWEILYAPSGTGEKLCVVSIGPKRPSMGTAKLGAALSAGSTATATSATATLWRRNKSTNAMETAAQTITVWSWFATAFATNDFVTVGQDDDGDWWLMTADCT